jgi:hypothetical protein
MTDAEHASVLRRIVRINQNFGTAGHLIAEERAAIERAIEALGEVEKYRATMKALNDIDDEWADSNWPGHD